MFENSDDDWETYGAENPYWGVMSNEKFLAENLDDQAMADFWASGEHDIDTVFQTIERHVDPGFQPRQVLDFGCGVGRLLFPISRRCEHATGVDVSPSMLAEAKRQAAGKSITNVSFIETNDCRELGEQQYCLVHSYIVFQHIPEDRGYVLLDRLLASLRSGGVGVLHFTFSNRRFWYWRLLRRIPFNKQLRNLLKGRALNAPHMQMNEYDLNIIMKKLWLQGASNIHVTFTDHGVIGAIIYFQKA
ncbi:MAG: class I SAM-dependent methyltransferase [Halioglobus sp.]|nr:class I SAM-dependent methyltransferase [Halioglobus sp.]